MPNCVIIWRVCVIVRVVFHGVSRCLGAVSSCLCMLGIADNVTGMSIQAAQPILSSAYIQSIRHSPSADFFASYRQILSLEPAFFELRRHIYNLYPLLVHLATFGSKYQQPLDSILRRSNFRLCIKYTEKFV